MRKLPKIYRNDISKRINNNRQMCYVEEIEDIRTSQKEIEEKLSKVFAGLGQAYNTRLIIETENKIYDTSLVAKSKEELITIDNETIKIKDIKNLTIKK